jgi:hypothetical protein
VNIEGKRYMSKCYKCSKDISKLKYYGGYAIEEGRDLCKDCWMELMEIKRDYHSKMRKFWEKQKEYKLPTGPGGLHLMIQEEQELLNDTDKET